MDIIKAFEDFTVEVSAERYVDKVINVYIKLKSVLLDKSVYTSN